MLMQVGQYLRTKRPGGQEYWDPDDRGTDVIELEAAVRHRKQTGHHWNNRPQRAEKAADEDAGTPESLDEQTGPGQQARMPIEGPQAFDPILTEQPQPVGDAVPPAPQRAQPKGRSARNRARRPRLARQRR